MVDAENQPTPQYAYVAKFHLSATDPQPSLFHARSLAELAGWASFHSMAIGPVARGTNRYQPEHVDGSALSADELARLPVQKVEDWRWHGAVGRYLAGRVNADG